jgi:hypothetical protein
MVGYEHSDRIESARRQAISGEINGGDEESSGLVFH